LEQEIMDSNNEESQLNVLLDYYQGAFSLLHDDLTIQGYKSDTPHPIRKRFWGLVTPGEYTPLEGRSLVLSYIKSVEDQLKDIIGKNSIAYWMHLYRRILPGPIGEDRRAQVIAEVRATLEAAIQKYAKLQPCKRVGISSDTPPENILGGLMMLPEFVRERESLQKNPQLVLTDFTSIELKEFYNLERLVYEMWRSGSLMRVTGKGANILVTEYGEYVQDNRTHELHNLIRNYDLRNASIELSLLSAKGVVDDYESLQKRDGFVLFLPIYNASNICVNDFDFFFSKHNIKILQIENEPLITNFIWYPANFGGFRDLHKPFANAFQAKHKISLDAVLVVLASLLLWVLVSWDRNPIRNIMRAWQRAYEGPILRDLVIEEIQGFSKHAMRYLKCAERDYTKAELLKAIEFWELTNAKRSEMDILYPGPHYLFLPYDDKRIFIDYSWISRRLHDLFIGVNIDNQNFKGLALETLIRKDGSQLPVTACKSLDGEKRQIDAAFSVGDLLVIVECRAVGQSIGFHRGQIKAINYRNKRIKSSLEDIDEKASWLAEHPKGKNYNITNYRNILPICVSPFVEFIPKSDSYYWLTDDLPRILIPRELFESLEEGLFQKVTNNLIPIE